MTVTLRALTPGDDGWLDAWLKAVAASVGYDGVHADAPAASLRARLRRERGLAARVIERDGDAAGVVVYRAVAPSSVVIEFVATPPALARRGSAMRAMALLEDECRAAGTRAIFAPAPSVHGIAMYFWIRLGYRPLLRGEWPCEREGVAWLRRDIGSRNP